MKEDRAVHRIEANLPHEKIDFINDVHAKEVDYWKRIALEGRKVDEKKTVEKSSSFKSFFWLLKILERVELKIFMKYFFI